jgi:hypothetical protein|tara:strand:- start:2924 stop:3043 length:120 start_codon:yes stop_codon:yes gene_type:complete
MTTIIVIHFLPLGRQLEGEEEEAVVVEVVMEVRTNRRRF